MPTESAAAPIEAPQQRLHPMSWLFELVASLRQFVVTREDKVQNVVNAESSGVGVRDGSTSRTRWIGRVPFEQLPHAIDPPQGFLSSTNQDPADAAYPYYLGRDWYSNLRSLRIDTLLRGKERHSVEDLVRYQSDVRAMQRDLLSPMHDTLKSLPPRADTLRRMLVAWNGDTDVDRPEPTVLYFFVRALDAVTWDESVFRIREPAVTPHVVLLRDEPTSRWLDRPNTRRLVNEAAGSRMRKALRKPFVHASGKPASTKRLRVPSTSLGRNTVTWRLAT